MIALAAGMRLQAGLVTLDKTQRGYTFDVKPRWNLAELQAEPAQAALAG
jgi:N6-L-threonylcarbamoyladenine synthase